MSAKQTCDLHYKIENTSWPSDISNSYCLIFHCGQRRKRYTMQHRLPHGIQTLSTHGDDPPALTHPALLYNRAPLGICNPTSSHPAPCKKKETEENKHASAYVLAQHVSAGCARALISLYPTFFCGEGKWKVGTKQPFEEDKKPFNLTSKPSSGILLWIPFCLLLCLFVIPSPSIKKMKRRVKCYSDFPEPQSLGGPTLQTASRH